MPWLVKAVVALGMAAAPFPLSTASPPPVRPHPATHQVSDGQRVRYARPVLMETPGGPRPVASLLRVDGPLRYGSHVWDEAGAAPGETWVRVDLPRQLISVFRGADEIGTAVVLFGTDGKPTPRGAFRVLERDRDHVSSLYGAPMPFMLRLTDDGVAIHASEVRRGSATHGCIGVPPAFAERLYAVMRRGAPVYVV
jgi:lipoprotein-anchoring transpeptidase ErfK/SrfK